MGSWTVRPNWATSLSLFTFMHWRRRWQPTPVFLPGESQRWQSLVGCRLWGHTESDTTEVTSQQQMYTHWFKCLPQPFSYSGFPFLIIHCTIKKQTSKTLPKRITVTDNFEDLPVREYNCFHTWKTSWLGIKFLNIVFHEQNSIDISLV